MIEALKTLDPNQFKPIFAGDPEHLPNVKVRLDQGRAISTRQARRTMRALDQPRKAAEQIGHLPDRDESRHLVLHGSYPLAAFIPAFVKLAGEPIQEFYGTTLSFSESNIDLLERMVMAGELKQVSIICSNFFAAEGLDKRIYDRGVEFAKKHGYRIAAVRNHSKLMLFRFKRRRFVVSSSANWRSASNIESAEIYQSPELYNFHRDWIEELLDKGAEK
jgi:hypothetical protein